MHKDFSIKLAAMSLGWGNPSGEDLAPFLKEVKEILAELQIEVGLELLDEHD